MCTSPVSKGETRCSKEASLLEILAAKLSAKIRRAVTNDTLVVGISGSEIGELVAEELGLRYQDLSIQPIRWPHGGPHTTAIVGAVSGCTDVMVLDDRAIQSSRSSQQEIMAHVQRVKLECMFDAVARGITLSESDWSGAPILLVSCPHSAPVVLETAVRIIKFKAAQSISIAVPFLASTIRRDLSQHVSMFVTLKEFDEDRSATLYAERLSHLDSDSIRKTLDRS